MSLTQKFAVLLGLLGLTVATALGAALAFGSSLDHQLRGPMLRTARILNELAAADRAVREAADNPDSASTVAEAAAALRTNPDFDMHAGVSTARAVLEGLDEVRRASIMSEAAVADDAGARTLRLIRRVERRIAENAAEQARFGDEQQVLFRVVLSASVLIAALFGLLGALLMRRWVVRPVARLREAADEIARGNYEHRLPVAGRDELARLAGEVNHMSGMIATMQREAVENERLAAVGQVVRRLAHSIRNPLSGIRASAELSRRQAGPGSPIGDNQQQIIETVDRFNSWLIELLDTTSPATVNMQPVEVRRWIDGLIAPHRLMAQAKSVELVVELGESPAEARFDPRSLGHAVVALLTNAIQASPVGGAVTVGARHDPGTSNWEIWVNDKGPGIDPALHEVIFRPSFTTKRDGTGIGLAVAHNAVKAHGGRIDVESAPGRGSTFFVRIPSGDHGGDHAAEFNRSAESDQDGNPDREHPRRRG